MAAELHFLQGVYAFAGQGLERPVLLDDALVYDVPPGAAAQVSSFRGGNSSDELILVLVLRGGVPVHYFPIGARGDVHVPLRSGQGAGPGEHLELAVAAPVGASGEVVVDLCLLQEASDVPEVPEVPEVSDVPPAPGRGAAVDAPRRAAARSR